MKKQFLYCIILSFILSNCSEKKDKDTASIENKYPDNPNYQLSKPDRIWELPSILNEISGIALVNDSTMLCVQDEKGYLFYYNLISKEIDKKSKFSYDADYEDLEIIGKRVFILRSKGWIYETQMDDPESKSIIHKTGLSRKNDTEGLCYDSMTNRLYISCKGVSGIKKALKGSKAVYAFDLETKKLLKEPILTLPEKGVKPSAIAIHPISKNIFILSSPKKKLLVLNPDGTILFGEALTSSFFMQPEGMTFASNGDLYISNEGTSGKANILLFKYKDTLQN